MNAITPRARSRFGNRSFVHAAVGDPVIADCEAAFQVMMRCRQNPGLWRQVFDLRDRSVPWTAVQTLLPVQCAPVT